MREIVGAALIALATFAVVKRVLGADRRKVSEVLDNGTATREQAATGFTNLMQMAAEQIRNKPESFRCGAFVLTVDRDNKPDNWVGGGMDTMGAVSASVSEIGALRGVFEGILERHQQTVGQPKSPDLGGLLGTTLPPFGGTIHPQ